jgi:hypothetical protein
MVGLLVASVIGSIIFLFVAFASQVGGDRARVLRTGLDARGIILWADRTAVNSTVGGVRYETRQLRLDVEIPGRAPYEMSVSPLIPRVCEALPGATLDLRVDPKDPNNVAVLGPAGSLGWMTAMPQLFPQVGASASAGLRPVYVLFFVPVIAVLGILALVGGSGEAAHKSSKAAAPAKSHELCEAAARCCLKVSPGASCNSYKTMPEQSCRSVLDAERKIAVKMKKVCE